jgi:hypothetical protein
MSGVLQLNRPLHGGTSILANEKRISFPWEIVDVCGELIKDWYHVAGDGRHRIELREVLRCVRFAQLKRILVRRGSHGLLSRRFHQHRNERKWSSAY